MTVRALGFLVVFSLFSLTSAQEKRAMTTDDGLDLIGIGDVLMSPDGHWVFYSESRADWEKDKAAQPKRTHYMIPATGGEAFRFIGKDGGNSFQFSPDGSYLSFKRKVDKKQQLFLMRTNGGEAVQVTKSKTSIGRYQWSDDSGKLYYVAPRAKSKEEKEKVDAGYDAIFVDEGPNGQQAGSWNELWEFDIETEKAVKLTSEDFRIGSFDVSPDGKRVIFTARYENRRNQGYLSEIYLMTLGDSAKIRLTNNLAPESDLLWAPDGKQFAYSAVSDDEWELRSSKIWLMNPDTGDKKCVSRNFEGRIDHYVWTPDGDGIRFTARQKTNSNLYEVDLETETVTNITNLNGSVANISFSKDRTRFAYTFQDFDTPPDLYAASTTDFDPTRLTDVNSKVQSDFHLAKGEIIKWTSKDGIEIEGVLFLPESFQSGEKLPLLLHVHGGPAGAFTNSFRYQYHVWAGLGYAQLCPNVRGSSGYGDAFLRGNLNDIGGGDYWDLMTGVDYVIEQGYADREQLGIRGWSYGGILGGWTITQTDRFEAASIGAMVSDWTSEYGPGFNYDVRLWYIGGTPWDNPEQYRQMSPLTHVKNVTTPTLILHGIRDRTDTEPQSMMFFTALKDQGKTVRYLKFPREPHGFREPRHRRTRDIEEIRWMQKHVRGIEWQPWERKEEKEKDEEDTETPVTTAQAG